MLWLLSTIQKPIKSENIPKNAFKKALPKNHDQKSAEFLPQDTIFKRPHILMDKVPKASDYVLMSLLQVVIKIFCDLK